MAVQPASDVLKIDIFKLAPAKYILPIILAIKAIYILVSKSKMEKEKLVLTSGLTAKDSFEMKSVTFIIGSPEEVAQSLLDADNRS
mmetsp:Transcript_17936/g.12931  ORF Transcript_17936/g.12931 Transcript_17936/m.12931 type:complete len:86 (+) Transcript_17936:262-519(+)